VFWSGMRTLILGVGDCSIKDNNKFEKFLVGEL
jgi:hypothetical protein